MDAIKLAQKELTLHPVYQTFKDLDSVRHFMQYHVFAVWDFMSLLKSLQIHMTCVTLPWKPSPYPAEMVRLINQIVVGEESDLDQNGEPISHFDLYLRSMEEIGADTTLIKKFLSTMDYSLIPSGAREFVKHNIEVAEKGSVVEVAASFFFGREKLIPEMFQSIVDVLKAEKVNAPTFTYYLERHIEVDGEEHGPLALKCLDHLTVGSPEKRDLALKAGLEALTIRKKLWDETLRTLNQNLIEASSQAPSNRQSFSLA